MQDNNQSLDIILWPDAPCDEHEIMDYCWRIEAKQALERKIIEAKIEELGNVQLDYGNQQARVWVDGKLVGILDRLAELKAQLKPTNTSNVIKEE